MLVTLSWIVMLVRLLQPSNAQSLILVTLFGNVILSRFVHYPNAEWPIVIKWLFLLNSMLLRLLQLSNAPQSILITLSGIVILVRLLQSLNAKLLIFVTLFGILILVRLLHIPNAPLPMLVILSGNVILVRSSNRLKKQTGTWSNFYNISSVDVRLELTNVLCNV